jgi:hypothetical protein
LRELANGITADIGNAIAFKSTSNQDAIAINICRRTSAQRTAEKNQIAVYGARHRGRAAEDNHIAFHMPIKDGRPAKDRYIAYDRGSFFNHQAAAPDRHIFIDCFASANNAIKGWRGVGYARGDGQQHGQ